MKIFISSTYEDLKNERKEAIPSVERIGQAIAMEKFFVSNHQSKDVCLKRLQECDALVLILGFRYGSIDKAEGISFTEIEYNTAKTLGLPVFVFQKCQSDGNWRPEETDSEKSKKLLAFKSRLDDERYKRNFSTPQKLTTEIFGAIYQYEKENGEIGVRLPAFSSYEDFFKPFLDNTKLFNHVYPLVGRKDFLEQLDTFVESDNKRIALLYGRGGIGKSKILFEFSQKFKVKYSEWKLRFLREGIALSDAAIRQLPAQQCIVVVDDAHRREDLSTLFTMTQQYSDRVKLILSIRPQGLDYVRATLTGGGFDPREVESIPEVGELNRDELEELGREVLGKDHQQFLGPLIQVAKDSPLVLVIGGRLLAEDKINPAMLERHSDFQRVVFDRFQDVLIGQVSDKLEASLCRDILSLISAISPIKPQTETFQEHASKFLNIDSVKLIDAISTLESTGILLRRGYSLRITPDVLSDHILYNACITGSGQPTGYEQKVFNAFGHIFPENVLFSLSELDWRITREGKSIDLLGEIWEIIENEFRGASHFQRSQILKHLEKVAYFQPARTLRLVEYAIHNPSMVSDNEEWAPQYTHKDVLNALPPLLKGIASNPDYSPRCCDLLWYLGRDDERPTNDGLGPEPAMSVLSALAEYDIRKPVKINSAVLDAIERWLKEPDAHEHIHSPLDVLDPLLAKEGDSTRLQGYGFVSMPFAVNPETTKSIHEKAISLLSDCTKSQSTKVVLRALKSLIDTLIPPRGRFNRVVSGDEINQWLPEQMRILEVIENLIKNTKDSIVHIEVASDLQWHAKRSSPKVIAKKADSIIKTIPDSFDLRINRAIGYHYDSDWNGEDYNQHRKRVKEEMKQTVSEFLDRFNDGWEVFDYLNVILSHFQNCGIQAQPGDFLHSLSTTDCKLSIEICKHIIPHSSSPLAIYISSLLVGIQEKSPTKAIELTKLAVETKNKSLCHSIAQGYAPKGGDSSIETDEISVIKTLLTYPDRSVKLQAIKALCRFPDAKRDKAIQLALSIDIEEDEKLADTLCNIFNSVYGIPPDELNDGDLQTILFKLTRIRELDDHLYPLYEFLGYCSSRIPEAVVDFLLERLNIAEKREKCSGGKFQPLPYLGFHQGLKDISSSPNYKDILRRVRDRALNPTAIDYLPELFAELSNDFSSTCLEVLDEWIESDDVKKIRGVGLLVKNAPPEFIFSHSEFVSRLIEKSYAVGDDCYFIVTSNLSSRAILGVRTGIAGKPMPQDEKLRDQAKNFSQKFPVGSPTQRFYLSLSERAELSIRNSLARDEELFEE
ncbi:hypothetical protein C5S32_09555 [ANME-1 cluster archaeon GoMg1]|nr:hypothetical protein [ANME-1 cluster archaeon GoMg1]